MEDLNSCIREKANPIQINECRSKIATNGTSFTQLSGILSLAGNEVRLKILYLLEQEKELCPCDLGDILGMSIPAISQHLRKMKDGNIGSFGKTGSSSLLVKNSISDSKKIIFNLEKAQYASRNLCKKRIIYRFSPKVTKNRKTDPFNPQLN
ncbi:ArsR/SmtB family transcription factor [Pedobacter nutrimenti]|uniref:Regulatory ArsR family protein n=1 Tax=Pedobacter nutrimenti TaxID=1241337 RepID=A0A318UKW5_9SPHI|nr:metalloregulator ArsR/SmtB family transcription factor [Pedobacter nutrimenti]PYF74645.1 regulatory ArsR family protein [Pedobacter nutrimenti]